MYSAMPPENPKECPAWWEKHLKVMKTLGYPDDILNKIRLYINSETVYGYGAWEIRPGPLGRWDVLYRIADKPNKTAVKACGISIGEYLSSCRIEYGHVSE